MCTEHAICYQVMYTPRTLYYLAFVFFSFVIWYNLVNFNNARLFYAKNYALVTHNRQEIVYSTLPNMYVAVNLTEDIDTHQDDNTIAESLKKQVRVLIWVMTTPEYHKTRAKSVKETWGKHCDQLIFFSSKDDPALPSIGLNVTNNYKKLTPKTMAAFRYIYDNHLNDADWFMKVDDDTFVIIENLRYFLSQHNPNDPLFFGHHFKWYIENGYHSGGAGYVLSKEALKRFGLSWNKSRVCDTDGWAEDKEIAKCMQNLSVEIKDSRDALGRSRFHCFTPKMHVLGQYPDWYFKRDAYGAKTGSSDYAISFHYIKPDDMHALEYFVYHLRPYGIISSLQNLNKKSPDTY